MRILRIVTIAFSALSALSTFAFAETWQSHLQVSPADHYGRENDAGIDANGNGLVVWTAPQSCGSQVCYSLLSRELPASGQPGPIETVTRVQPNFGAYSPKLFVADTGDATLLWVDERGLVTENKPFGAGWTAPVILKPLSGIQALAYGGDHAGDVVVLLNSREVLLRRDDYNWRSASAAVPANVPYVDANASVVVSVSGEVAVNWYSYDEKCVNHDCRPYNFQLHISTLPPGASAWQVADFFVGEDQINYSTNEFVAIDDDGRVGFATDSANGVLFVGQSVPGEAWNAPVLVSGKGMVIDLQSDGAGDLTALLMDGPQPQVFTGRMAGGPWTQAHNPFGKYPLLPPSTPKLWVAPSGSAVLGWTYVQSQSSNTSSIVASTRPSATASWKAPEVLSPSSLPYVTLFTVSAAGVDRALLTWWNSTSAGSSYLNASVHVP